MQGTFSGPDFRWEEEMSLIAQLEKAQAEVTGRNADPWHLPLERLRGKVDPDGLERVTTQHVFDQLDVQQRERTSAACRRLARVMRDVGWTAVRVKGLTRGGYLEQVRGYCRLPDRQRAA